MASRTRLPTWKERDNNKRRERKRRAIASKIFAGLRLYGNYELPKHCDNNEVLKALCREAGWTVEEDGTTYRKGCKPSENMDIVGGSVSPSPSASYQLSPSASYNPSPTSSSLPSPASSSQFTNANASNSPPDPRSLIPWLKNLPSASPCRSSSKTPSSHQFFIHGGSISAPVTPPLSSPTARTPRIKTDWDDSTASPSWAGTPYVTLPSSTPVSPGHPMTAGPSWFAGLPVPTAPLSPTFSLVSSNPFAGFFKDSAAGGCSSRMCTVGQSGTCSPAIPGGHDVPMSEGGSDEFTFGGGGSSNGHSLATGMVKAWEGERIHEECASDDLDLTLWTSKTRSDT